MRWRGVAFEHALLPPPLACRCSYSCHQKRSSDHVSRFVFARVAAGQKLQVRNLEMNSVVSEHTMTSDVVFWFVVHVFPHCVPIPLVWHIAVVFIHNGVAVVVASLFSALMWCQQLNVVIVSVQICRSLIAFFFCGFRRRKWISPSTLALVTADSVFHWSMQGVLCVRARVCLSTCAYQSVRP